MTQIPFKKVALTYTEQIKLLKNRGLFIENEEKTLHLLSVISYYRLSGYWYPLLEDKTKHQFKKNATFEVAFQIYKFDRELRLLILQELEKIEIAVRARMIYILSHNSDAFWYLNSNCFSNKVNHSYTVEKMKREFEHSDDDFILSFKSKYSNPLPPSWMMMEITSFGNLSNLYSNLLPGRNKREIAKCFGLNDRTFASWLHSITYLRNICAHHSRLWNRELRIKPLMPNNPNNPFLAQTTFINQETGNISTLNNKVYFSLSMIIYLMNTINPKNSFKEKFNTLLAKYPNIDTRAMGFPEAWDKENIWK